MIRTFDEVTKKALLGLLPMAPGATISVTLDCFDALPEDARPLFHIRDLNADQWRAMRQAMRVNGFVDQATMIKTLQEGALGSWENLPDNQFNEILFSKDAIAALPFRWIEVLYWKCADLCSPNKTEREALGFSPAPTSDTSSKAAPSADAAQA
jgi:hypothetical protein